MRVVDPVKASWRFEIKHVSDLVVRGIKSHQMFKRRQALQVGQVVVGNIHILQVAEPVDPRNFLKLPVTDL